MGRLLRTARVVSPVNRAAVAMWAWRHRDEISGWASYVARSAPRLVAGDSADVIAEGRLRARLTGDGRTRDVKGLEVSVEDGVARLSGSVETDVADAAREIALDTSGIRRVRDDLRSPTRRGRRR